MNLESLLSWVRIGVAILVGLVLLWYVLIPFLRQLVQPIEPPDRVFPQLTVPPSPKKNGPPKTPDGQKIIEVAKQDPQKTAHLIQAWLRENNRVE